MPLEHSHGNELLVPYIQRERERRAAHARLVRSARDAGRRRGTERVLLALTRLARWLPSVLRRDRRGGSREVAPARRRLRDADGSPARTEWRATRSSEAGGGRRADLRAGRGSPCPTCA